MTAVTAPQRTGRVLVVILLEINAESRQAALTLVYAGLALAGLLGLLAATRLPKTPPLSQAPAAGSADGTA